MDKDKLVYDLAMICVKQCLTESEPANMDDACDLAVKAFEKAYEKITALIDPAFESINTVR